MCNVFTEICYYIISRNTCSLDHCFTFRTIQASKLKLKSPIRNCNANLRICIYTLHICLEEKLNNYTREYIYSLRLDYRHRVYIAVNANRSSQIGLYKKHTTTFVSFIFSAVVNINMPSPRSLMLDGN